MIRPVKYVITFSVISADGDGTVDDEEYTVTEEEKDAIARRVQDTDEPFVECADEDDSTWMLRKDTIRRVQINKQGRP